MALASLSRDASIEYWDAARELWVPIQPLLSNAAVHTHMFAKPVQVARFRLMLPWGVCGNLRLAEIVFHGELQGCSHPDVVAKRPLAESHYGGYGFAAGEPAVSEGATIVKQAEAPPLSWQVVRVDLWAAAKKPWRIRGLFLSAKGGGAAFDQIVLGRTEANLPSH